MLFMFLLVTNSLREDRKKNAIFHTLFLCKEYFIQRTGRVTCHKVMNSFTESLQFRKVFSLLKVSKVDTHFAFLDRKSGH